ncbi:radical SAM protein (TIGR01212 family) [Caldalkalibacillus uzonensis]|uniref:Radical SAM protein (TIGR01212 family) n=1 Tax=Caldalkalibacillus uzonensis TaxID=353224 RepID=A0ABU0CR44_9BACI|nr:TIGR01212 family radical SAM protein [Caldalkalibacillus uzonensis]MDQ0338870.1 radical SAM protein (TIGR01212 family) [Caldalkalibacillus uzonensis]
MSQSHTLTTTHHHNTSNETPRLWGDKRYHTWNYHLRQTFGQKVFKVSLDAGFTCPNRDGKVATGGCTFCSARGSGDFAGDRRDDLLTQFEKVKTNMHKKWPEAKYIGYFQAYTNTYAPAEELRDMYEAILEQDGVVGLSIATRPDCLPDDVVALLAELNERTYLWVELGLQTVHNKTGELINRGHDYKCYVEGVEKLRQHNIRVCCHIIYGLPQETDEMMLETAREVSKLDIQGLKIHLLHVLKFTPMVRQYEQGLLQFLEKDQYVNLVVKTLEMMPPELIIHRVTGDGPGDLLIGPMWSVNKWDVLNSIDRELKNRNTWQGKLWNPAIRLEQKKVVQK